jgi:hypothetical protein
MSYDSSVSINNHIYTGQLSVVTSLTSEISFWLQDAQKELQALKKMPENWDSYGSPEITNEASKKVADLLGELARFGMSKPNIFPVSGGGLQLEWQKNARELEIEILPDGNIEFLIVDQNGEMREGKAIGGDVLRLTQWYSRNGNNVMNL